MTPKDPRPPVENPAAMETPAQFTPVPPLVYRWYHKIWSFVFITFCLEVGLFLLIFPWTDLWVMNYFSNLFPRWEPFWDNMYVRGAVSGLGVANLYISMVEIFRLKRFVR